MPNCKREQTVGAQKETRAEKKQTKIHLHGKRGENFLSVPGKTSVVQGNNRELEGYHGGEERDRRGKDGGGKNA